MEKVKPQTNFKNVYVVQNYGTFYDVFYYLKDAKKYVEEKHKEEGFNFLQIYKCDFELKNVIQKSSPLTSI